MVTVRVADSDGPLAETQEATRNAAHNRREHLKWRQPFALRSRVAGLKEFKETMRRILFAKLFGHLAAPSAKPAPQIVIRNQFDQTVTQSLGITLIRKQPVVGRLGEGEEGWDAGHYHRYTGRHGFGRGQSETLFAMVRREKDVA